LQRAAIRINQQVAAGMRPEGNRALAGVLTETGLIYYRKGEYAESRKQSQQGLILARGADDLRTVALALNNLGLVSLDQGEYANARTLFEESLALRRELGEKWGITTSLNNLGNVHYARVEYAAAQAQWEAGQRLTMKEVVGLALQES
jgi:tetratricopeptide (TPR) repeat protein